MIGKLSGRLDSVDGNQIILDVQGVGYLVAVSSRTLRKIGTSGDAVALLIETHVREDAIQLFGFFDGEERAAFRLLTTVQGVGAKSALAILGLLGPDALTNAVLAQDKAALTRAEGVGPKLALRIVTELKDKIGKMATASLGAEVGIATAKGAGEGIKGDAVSALVNLGYKRMEAFAAVSAAAVKLGSEAKLDDLIRASLGELSRKETAE